MREIEENDDWSCFVCNKDILRSHRAQHWALRNFMNKQLEKIQQINVNSEDELNNLLNEDVSGCCPRKKRKSVVPIKPVVAPPIKRPSTSSGMANLQPPAKKIAITMPSKHVRPPIQNLQTYRSSPVAAKTRTSPKASNNEIVCTPDIMGLFNDNDDNSIPTTNMMPSTTLAPPPLVMRNNPRPIRPAGVPSPIYHNVNGYQIDLNHAARQEIFRLPNGKLIQVRKQTAPPIPGPFRPGLAPRGPQFTIRQANPVPMQTTTARMFRPQIAQPRSVRPTGPQQRFSFTDGRIVPANSAPTPTPPTPAVSTPSASTVFTQQNGSISVARAPQPNTPFGTSKVEFEDKIISGMEICQHTINKMITLTNSSSFKTSRNLSDLKDLYIHLQYLFTYTSGKFKTLQESLTTGMESLAKHDSALKEKEKDDADELEIVEEKQDVIEVLSDDEEPVVQKKKPGPASATMGAAALNRRSILKKSEDKEAIASTETSAAKGAEVISIGKGAPPEAPMTQIPGDEIEGAAEGVSIRNGLSLEMVFSQDKKLNNIVLVKVEKLEDSKNPIIKEILNKIQEREEMQTSDESSCDGSSDIPIDLNVVREEGDKEPAAIKVIPASEDKVDEGPQEEKENAEEPVEKADGKTSEKENEKAEEPSESPTTDEAVVEDKEPEKAAEVKEVVDIDSDDDDELVEPANKILSELSSKSDLLKIDTALPDELMEVDEDGAESVKDKGENENVEEKLESVAEAEKSSVEKSSPKSPIAEEKDNESSEKLTQETMSTMSATEIPASPNNTEADMNESNDKIDNAGIIEISSQDSSDKHDTSLIELSSQDSGNQDNTESVPDKTDEKAELNGFAKSPEAENGSEVEIDDVLKSSEIPDTDAMLNDMKTIESNLSTDDITKITEHDINSLIDTLGEEPAMEIDESF